MRPLALLILTTLIAAATAAAPSSLREGLSPAAQQDWLAVGRLNVAGQGFCTGTLVARDLVMTAAHCLVDRRTGRTVHPDRVHFLAGYRTGAYAAHGRGAALALIDGFSRRDLTVARDIGLVRLKDPMPLNVAPLPLAADLAADAELDVLSYSIDRSQLPSLQGACGVLQRRGAVLYTSCEGVPGVSGAPLVVFDEDGPRLAAVASSVSARRKRPIPQGNLIAIAADPVLTGALLAVLGLTPEALGPAP